MSQAASVESKKEEPRREEAPKSEQRDGLRSLLRGLTFAQQEEALRPGGGETPPGAPPRPAKDRMARLATLVPVALEGIGDTEGAVSPPGASQTERPKDDGADKESQEGMEATQLLDESEAPAEPPEPVVAPVEADEAESEETTDAAAETVEAATPEAVEAPPEPASSPGPVAAPVQMKAKHGAKPAPKPAAKPAPKPAPGPANAPGPKPGPKPGLKPGPKPGPRPSATTARPANKLAKPGTGQTRPRSGTSKTSAAGHRAGANAPSTSGAGLDAAAARAAYRWTMRQGFASVPFIVRRYQLVLGVPANGKVEGNWHFVQAVAAFQVKYGVKAVDGKLAGITARKMRYILRTRHGLDKKNLLTSREVAMAQKKNVAAIRNDEHPLKWKVVKELRKLFDLPEKGGLSAAFLRKVAEFQRKHELGYSAQLTGRTINTIRAELGDTWHHPLPGGVMTSPFGMRYHPIHHQMRMHEGVDLAGPTRIVAARSGRVKSILSDPSGYGNYLILSHKDCDTLYAHCSAIHVKQGQPVKGGDKIATAGETGGSRGVHLHFEVHKPGYRNPVDPAKFI